MKTITIRTRTGSLYRLTYTKGGEWYIGAVAANGVGARFLGRQFRIEEPDIPVTGERLTVWAHPDERNFPSSSGWLSTSPVEEVTYSGR